MENLTLIPSEKIESIQLEIREIKELIKNKNQEEARNKWLTKKEARSRLKICLKTLDSYLSKGILPYSKFAGKTYIKAGDIEAHLEKHYIKNS